MCENRTQHSVILFDGQCNLCSGAVLFIIPRDSKQRFRFAALESVPGQQLLAQQNCAEQHFSTVVLIENGRVYTKSTAALRIARRLDGLWPVLYLLMLVPKRLRDRIYDWVADNRYRWFGARATCLVPSPAIQGWFLSEQSWSVVDETTDT